MTHALQIIIKHQQIYGIKYEHCIILLNSNEAVIDGALVHDCTQPLYYFVHHEGVFTLRGVFSLQ